MRRFFAVALIFVAFTLALTMMFNPGAAQASPAAPNPLLAGPSPTPTRPLSKIPPAGALAPTPEGTPSTNPISGGDRPDDTAGLLMGLGGALAIAGVIIWRRQRGIA